MVSLPQALVGRAMITVLRRKKKAHASALQNQFHAAVAAAWLRVTSVMPAFSTSAQSGRAAGAAA